MTLTAYANIFSKGIKDVALPAITSITTKLADTGIQLSRQIPAGISNNQIPTTSEKLKNIIKAQFSTISSAVSAFAFGMSFLDFYSTLTNGKLDSQELQILQAIATVSVLCEIYSLSRFGVEKNTKAAGYVAAFSTLLLEGGKLYIEEFVNNNETYNSCLRI